jgi:hypothetical protein
MKTTFSTKKIFTGLLLLSLFFILVHLILHALAFGVMHGDFLDAVVNRFNVDAEQSIPTWYAQLLLFAVALLAASIALAVRKVKGAHAWEWWLLSFVFVYLSIDESTSIHEFAAEPTRELFGITSGILFFAWYIPVLAIVALLGIFMLRWFIYLPSKTRNLLTLSFLLFVAGAVGMEVVSGAYWANNGFHFDFTYSVLNAIEEGLEMFGVIIAIYALLEYAREKKISIGLS